MPNKTGLSQDQFRLAVQNERTIELAYEGHRYNDLKPLAESPYCAEPTFPRRKHYR